MQKFYFQRKAQKFTKEKVFVSKKISKIGQKANLLTNSPSKKCFIDQFINQKKVH